ncbi:hypothetical protein GE09DRAFT_95638 [Coniochaeta sp. 2T2.1]|nr:hypothetical protein GE09DRAFT_95638 [Coniochaeta sp. 2T2.1]
MSLQLPDTVTGETITAEWLNAKLGINTIEHISLQNGGDNHGFTDAVYRIHLTHRQDDNNPARSAAVQPATLIMKVIDSSPGNRAVFKPLHEREVLFYNEIAPVLDLASVPKCYYAHFDEEAGKGTILLEDAGKPTHKGGLQKDGFETLTASQAVLAMTELGRFHGRSIALSSKLPRDLSRPLDRSIEEIRAAFPSFKKTWTPLLGEEVIGRYERALEAYEKVWLVQKDTFVQGLVHGDYRLGNIIFSAEDGQRDNVPDRDGDDLDNAHAFESGVKTSVARGYQEATTSNGDSQPGTVAKSPKGLVTPGIPTTSNDTTINGNASPNNHPNTPTKLFTFKHVDWQTVSRGPVLFDVAYLLSMSITTETRRGCEFDLVHAWYTACREAAGAGNDQFFLSADLNISPCVREISAACVAVVLVSVTTMNNFRAPEVPMRAVAGKLRTVSEMLVDWRSFE